MKDENNINILNEFYVYLLLNPLKPCKVVYKDVCFLYEPFYIGKGKGNRYNEHCGYELSKKRRKHNPIKTIIIEAILNFNLKPILIKYRENLIESESFEIEKEMILYFGKKCDGIGGILSNISNGGKGGDNYSSLSDDKKKEISEKLSKSLTGKKYYRLIDKRRIPIIQYDKDNIFIQEWISISKASKDLGIHKWTIICCLKNKGYKSAGGFIWKYKNS